MKLAERRRPGLYMSEVKVPPGRWWLMPVILTNEEDLSFRSGKIVFKTLSPK
jgi:hypothetical protein